MSGPAAYRKPRARDGGTQAEHISQFNVGHVEPTPSGLLAWRALTFPPPTEAEERAMVRAQLKRGLRHDQLDELRRLGFPLD